ncbi:MAG: hypothetical protein ACOYYS_08440 [Chloroflexota bacterium]
MKRFFILATVILSLAACSGSSNTAASAVQAYFQALVDKDTEKAVNLSCAAWEEQARIDADAFATNPATAQGLACQDAGTDGEYTTVTCTGRLVLDYNGEEVPIDLADRSYLALEENGEWRMCGLK